MEKALPNAFDQNTEAGTGRDADHHTADHKAKLALRSSAQSLMLDNELLNLWAGKRKRTPRSVDDHRSVARWFYHRLGSKPVHQITTKDVLDFAARLRAEGQTPANINVKLKRLRSLLNYAAQNGHTVCNVASGISVIDAHAYRNKRRSFDLRSLRAIFSGPVHANGQRPIPGRGEASYWLPLLALFTGARMEQLGRLRPSDILLIAYPVPDGNKRVGWFIRLVEQTQSDAKQGDKKRLGNAGNERLVPVHSELERLGFLRFASSIGKQGHPRLFHLLAPGRYGNLTHRWGQWFSNYARNICGVTDKCLTFDSFRLTFVDFVCRLNEPPAIQRQLVGHRKKNVQDSVGSEYKLHWLVESVAQYSVTGWIPPPGH